MSKLAAMTLKDRRSREYDIEETVLDALDGDGREAGELFDAVAGVLGGVERSVFDSVLYGMRKEGLVGFEEGRVVLAG
jgi:hypothetical protein